MLNNLERLAHHVTAGDLEAEFGPRLTLAGSIEEARDMLRSFPARPGPVHRDFDSEVERICLVHDGDDDEPSHFVWGEDLLTTDTDTDTVSAVATPLAARFCVTDTTPALTLMQRFHGSDTPWCLVMSGTELTGYVSWVDLFRPELRVCVLALLLDVEQRCSEAVTWEPGDAYAAWARLSAGRQAKAAETFERRRGRPPGEADVEELIYSTTFIDKAALISGLPQFSGLSRRQLSVVFSTMEKVRNTLAHTSMDSRGDFQQLVMAVHLAEVLLKALTPKSDVPPLRLVVSDSPISVGDLEERMATDSGDDGIAAEDPSEG
jgi:hypothetical protein